MKNKYKIALILFSVILLGLIVFLYCFKVEKTQTLKRYYPDSKETYIHEYIIRNGDTILQGKVNIFNEKGIKVAEGNLINNVTKGKFIYYYESGKIESIKYVIDNKKNAEILWNYPSGKIKEYILFDDTGNAPFIIKYNENGVVASYKGTPSFEFYQYKFANKEQFNIKEDQYLKVGDTLKYKYLIANIPNTERILKIENLSVDNSKVKRLHKQINLCQLDVEEILTKKGKNTIRAVTQYRFKDNVTSTIKDTTFFDVEIH